MEGDAQTALRDRIASLLADGLVTQTEPFPEDGRAYASLLAGLQDLPPDDLAARLVLSGFSAQRRGTVDAADAGDIAQACETCMYFAQHRRFCELPELLLPVLAEWSCRLWRI